MKPNQLRNKWGQFRKPMIFCPAAPFVPRIVNPLPVAEKKTVFYGFIFSYLFKWAWMEEKKQTVIDFLGFRAIVPKKA